MVIGDIVFIDAEGYIGAGGTVVDEFNGGIHEIAGEKGNMKTEFGEMGQTPALSAKEK